MSVPCFIIYERISLAFQQQTGELRACWGWKLDLSVVKLCNITHQSFVAGAFYGALGKELAVLFFREQFPLMRLHSQKTVGGLELGQANGGLPP